MVGICSITHFSNFCGRWTRRSRHGMQGSHRRDVVDYRTGYIRSHLRSPSGRVRWRNSEATKMRHKSIPESCRLSARPGVDKYELQIRKKFRILKSSYVPTLLFFFHWKTKTKFLKVIIGFMKVYNLQFSCNMVIFISNNSNLYIWYIIISIIIAIV